MIQRFKDKIPQIHPTAWVHPMATVIGDVVLGAHVSVWPGAVLRGDCGPIRIGAFTNIQDGTVVHTTQDLSETHVGERVTVGHNAILHGCRIGDDCLVGMHATVLDNAVISHQTIIGAGSVVREIYQYLYFRMSHAWDKHCLIVNVRCLQWKDWRWADWIIRLA